MSYFKDQLVASLGASNQQVSFQESMEAYYEVKKIETEVSNEALVINRTESIVDELQMQNVAIEQLIEANGRLTEGEAAAFEAARRSAAIALGLSVESLQAEKMIDTVGLESMVMSKGSVSLEGVKEVLEKIKQALIKFGKWVAEKFKAFVSFLRKAVKFHSAKISKVYEGIYALSDSEYEDAKKAKVEEIKQLEVTDKDGKLTDFTTLSKEVERKVRELNAATGMLVTTAEDIISNSEKDGTDSLDTQEISKQLVAPYKVVDTSDVKIGPMVFKFKYSEFIYNAVRKAEGKPSGNKGFEQIYNEEEDVVGELSASRTEFLKVINIRNKIDSNIDKLATTADALSRTINSNVVPKLSKLIDQNKKNEKVNGKVLYSAVMRATQGASTAVMRLLSEYNTVLGKTCKAGELIIQAAGKTVDSKE